MDKQTLQQLKQLRKKLKEQTSAAQHRNKTPSISEQQLFLQAMQGVKPLAEVAQFEHPQPVISPWPKKHEPALATTIDDNMSDFWPWDELGAGEQLLYAKPGLRLDALKKLKKGLHPVEAQLDLHGETVESARQKVAHFLVFSLAQQFRCVRIVHGKGLSSREGVPILKLKLKNWLVQRDEVLAFAQAKPAQGCAGAVLVLLKSGKNRAPNY